MNGMRRVWVLACCAVLLVVSGPALVSGAGAPPGRTRFEPEPRADATQRRRRTRRKAKKKMSEHAEAGRVAEGLWGGSHLRLNVRGDGATLDFDCAHGEINAPFILDAEGRFDLPGTYTREGPGPIRIGREPTARPARYVGRVVGERMTLDIKLEGSDKSLGQYTLTRGDEGMVVKCR
jgi:hypothetical protein